MANGTDCGKIRHKHEKGRNLENRISERRMKKRTTASLKTTPPSAPGPLVPCMPAPYPCPPPPVHLWLLATPKRLPPQPRCAAPCALSSDPPLPSIHPWLQEKKQGKTSNFHQRTSTNIPTGVTLGFWFEIRRILGLMTKSAFVADGQEVCGLWSVC